MTVLAGCAGPRRQFTDWRVFARHDAVPLARLPDLVRRARVVVVGEDHALVEPIETFRMLLADSNRVGFTHVAMEWSVTDQPDLERFLAGDDAVLDRFRRRYGRLPGVTEEYLSIFSFVRENNRRHPAAPTKICCLDVPHPVRNTPEEERDRNMFLRVEPILDAKRQHRVLVHGGATHTAKIGWIEQTNREGRLVQMPVLGTRLRERFGKEVVSIKVLSRYDPMWHALKQANAFTNAVVIPLTRRWPEPRRLFGLWQWHTPAPVNAKAAYDYVVWWPTLRDAKRAPVQP